MGLGFRDFGFRVWGLRGMQKSKGRMHTHRQNTCISCIRKYLHVLSYHTIPRPSLPYPTILCRTSLDSTTSCSTVHYNTRHHSSHTVDTMHIRRSTSPVHTNTLKYELRPHCSLSYMHTHASTKPTVKWCIFPEENHLNPKP